MSDDVNYINLERLRTFLQEVKRLIPTNYATKTELNNCFPKSGGCLSGTEISRNVDNDSLGLCGGTDYTRGAYIALRGKDYSARPGAFEFVARGDGNSRSPLIGTPDGSLTWRYKNIEVIEEQGDGYIRYSNGLQICWGSGYTADFLRNTMAKSFVNTQYRLTITPNGGNPKIGFNYVSNASFDVIVESTTYYTYLAIGKWK